jgi:methyl-accepting chemotaxis protein
MNEISGIINDTLVKTPDITSLLEKISIESEHEFIKLGTNLQKIYSDTKYLTELTRGIATLLDGSSNETVLGKVGVYTKESLLRLHACQEDVINILPRVEKYSSNMKRLHDMCPTIKNIAKKLNIVALHIAIESSRNSECEAMFSFFVQEIRQLADKVNTISVKIWEDAKKAKSEQISDLSVFEEKKDRLNTIAENAYHSVEDNIREIENLVQISLDSMKHAETHSKKLYSLVGEIVVAIQFHDITRQQIEHIIQSLGEIGPLLRADKNNETASSENHGYNLSKVFSILTQVRQGKKRVLHRQVISG